MADIELVIKVDERDVELVRKYFKSTGYSFIPTRIQTEFVSAILNSISLPKGHGRLIDADAILAEPIGNTYKDIDIAETIIEAERSEEE